MTGPDLPSPVPIESLPPSLVDLLTRELACRHARTQLTQSLDVARRQLQTLKATRSPFFILQSQDVRRDARTSQADAEETISRSEKALARLDQTESRLKTFVAYRLETHLRATSQDYVQVLLERHRVEDWQRWLRWFEHYSSLFRSTLALLEATITHLPPSQPLSLHPQCTALLAQAVESAHQVEAEVAFFNKIADAERRLHGPGSHSLHRQLALDWCSAVKSLNKADGLHGPHMVAQFISQFTEISRNISRALHDECAKPTTKDAIETNSFHTRQWALFHEAVQLRVNPGQLDEIARETDVFIENGRIAALARAHDEIKPAAPPPRPTTAPFPSNSANTNPAAPPPPPNAKPVLQLRSRRNVTGAPFGNIPPAAPGAGDTSGSTS